MIPYFKDSIEGDIRPGTRNYSNKKQSRIFQQRALLHDRSDGYERVWSENDSDQWFKKVTEALSTSQTIIKKAVDSFDKNNVVNDVETSLSEQDSYMLRYLYLIAAQKFRNKSKAVSSLVFVLIFYGHVAAKNSGRSGYIVNLSMFTFDDIMWLMDRYGIDTIDDSEFMNAGELADGGHIIVPDSITSIGKAAFQFSSITSIILGSGVDNIGYEAFRYCERLQAVDLSRTKIKHIDLNTFANSIHIKTFICPPELDYFDGGMFGTSLSRLDGLTVVLTGENTSIEDRTNSDIKFPGGFKVLHLTGSAGGIE